MANRDSESIDPLERDDGIFHGLDAAIGANLAGAPDEAAPRERFWVIIHSKDSDLPPRVREVEAVRYAPNSDQWLCRAVQGSVSSWHRFNRDVLYDDQETAELEAAEALLSGELAHR